jgi:hypothetical protein
MASKTPPNLPEWLPPVASLGTVEHYKYTTDAHAFRLALFGGGVIEVKVPHDYEGAGKVVTALGRLSEIIDAHRPEPKQGRLFKKAGAP